LVRWRSERAFRAAYAEASHARFDDATDELRAATSDAVAVLHTAVRDRKQPMRHRVAAAVSLIDLARKVDAQARTDAPRRVEPPIDVKEPMKGIIVVGGTEEEYVSALRHLRWSQGDIDEDERQTASEWLLTQNGKAVRA
jgi:hypothetical protein